MADPIATSAGISSDRCNTSSSNSTALHERLSMTTGPTRCQASSSAAPHAPLRKLITSMDDIASECEAQSSKEQQLDASEVACEMRQWQTSLSHILGNLNIAEEQRANDVLKAVDWYNNSLALAEKQLTVTHIVEMNDLYRKMKDELAKRENEFWQMRFTHEGEIWRLRREVERLTKENAVLRSKKDGKSLMDEQVRVEQGMNGNK